MIKIDKYILCVIEALSVQIITKIPRAHQILYTSISDYINKNQISIWYAYYTNTYVEPI